MKFLIDAQLPKSLSDFLKSKGYDCIHTLELPNKNNTTDNDILEYCESENSVVITKDNDFLESFLINNKPEKLIFVRTGNIKNSELHELFNINFEYLHNSISENNLIEVNKTDIIIHK